MESAAISCPIHKNEQHIHFFWDFKIGETSFQLYKCEQCKIAFYSPFPDINYENHTDSIASLRDYVHLNSNIEGLIQNLLDFIPEEGYQSMLEVGCGFGFTLGFAKHIFQMDVLGFEPSLYGELGSKELGLEIKRNYLTAENVQDKKVDLVYLSEVLEHISDPAPFIRLLKQALNDQGVLLLTTPDSEAIRKDLNDPSELALLSPGAHTILFSKEGLTSILKDCGFKHVTVKSMNHSLLAVCSVHEKKWKNFPDQRDLLVQYYNHLLQSVHPSSLTYIGILYRLFRNYIDFNQYAEADRLFREYPFPILPTLHEIRSIQNAETFHNFGPACGSILSYYIGILKMNHHMDFEEASRYFKISYLLCKKKLELMPGASVIEFDMVWLAKYHYALALFNGGQRTAALKEIKKIMNADQDGTKHHYLPYPGDMVKAEAEKLKGKIIDLL